MPKSKVNITQDDDDPIATEVLAQAICKLSDASNQLLSSGLNKKAIVVLLRDATNLSKRNITAVLDAMGQLRQDYTNG